MIKSAMIFSSEKVLYVYLFIEELIVQFHVKAVGSSCTHLYMIYQLLTWLKQLLTGLRLLTRPSLLTRTRDTIHFLQNPNRVNILNVIPIYSESSCGFYPHWGFPLAMSSLFKKIWCCLFSLCMVIYMVQHYWFTFLSMW